MTYKAELIQAPSNIPTYQIVLLDELNQPIGYALGEFRQYAVWYDGQPYFFVTTLTVASSAHRQKGVGNYLLKAVEAFARREGAHWVRGQLDTKPIEYMATPVDKRALRSFWAANGYGLKQEIYDESIRFWKPLNASRRIG